jgi:hypothetical protein
MTDAGTTPMGIQFSVSSIDGHVTKTRPNFIWPLGFLLIIVLTGMAYTVGGDPVIHHESGWLTPPDLWNTFRAAQYVVWGGEGQLYNNPAAYQTFPGIAIILSPIAKMANLWHWSTGYPVPIPKPSTWLLLGPIELALGGVLLFPLDELARRLLISQRRRIVSLFVESALIWPTVAIWGHPEDALSVAFGIYALMAAFDGSWHRAGLFFGLAIVVQPLILLLVPLAVALTPVRRWPILGVEALVPSLLLLLPPLIQEGSPTIRILTKQPNFLIPNQATPWISLAPVIAPRHLSLVHGIKRVKLPDGHYRSIEVTTRILTSEVVAAGPGRIIAVVLACVLGVVVKSRRPTLTRLTWFAALALSLRCMFEPVMVPYYLMPAMVLAVAATLLRSRARLFMVIIFCGACSLLSYHHMHPWAFYLVMMSTLLLSLFFSWPQSVPHDAGEQGPLSLFSHNPIESRH